MSNIGEDAYESQAEAAVLTPNTSRESSIEPSGDSSKERKILKTAGNLNK